MAEAIEGRARYFDGEIATRRDVRVRLADALEAIEADAVTARWPYASIRLADGGVDALRLRCETAPELARIEIREKPLADAVRLRCGALGSLDLRPRDIVRILIWSLAAAASIVAISLYGVPRAADGVARFVPASLEARLGDAAARQVAALFGDRTCRDGAAQAALDGLLHRLASAGGLAPPPPATVLQTQIPNAFALPGGRVFVLSALIDKARSPDELGGVLAHELGHVAHRDGLRLMISNGGSAFLFSLLFGDVTGAGAVIFASRTLVASAHTRQAEAAADGFAAKILHKLGRSSAPLGEFLLRMTGVSGKSAMSLIATHPASEDRLAALKRDDRPSEGAPLLSETEWSAIKNMCASASAP